MIPNIGDVVHVEALFPAFFAVASHIEAAYKLLLQIFRDPLGPLLFHLTYFRSMHFTIFDQLLQIFVHPRCCVFLDIIDASAQQRRGHYIEFCIALHKSEVAHEITEFAHSLCFFKTHPREPVAEHRNCIIHIHKCFFDEGYKFIPLLTMHDLPDSVPHRLIFIDLLLG